VDPERGEQDPMGGDPAEGGAHVQGPEREGRRRHDRRPGHQGRGQRGGLPEEAAHPPLAALVRHGQVPGGPGRGGAGATLPQADGEEARDHGNTEAEVGQNELRQQGHGAPTGPAQVAAHRDRAVKLPVHERAMVEAVRAERLPGVTLRAAGGPIPVGIGEQGGMLLERADERV